MCVNCGVAFNRILKGMWNINSGFQNLPHIKKGSPINIHLTLVSSGVWDSTSVAYSSQQLHGQEAMAHTALCINF